MTLFFFNDTATTEIYTRSLHDALPILCCGAGGSAVRADGDAVDRPGAGPVAEGDAQPRPVGDVHAPVAGLQALVEQRVQPVEVLHPRLDRVGRGQVGVDLHGEVRRQPEVT